MNPHGVVSGHLDQGQCPSFLLKQVTEQYSSPPLLAGDTFQDPRWGLKPETADSSEPDIDNVPSYMCMPVIKFDL